MNTVRLWSIVFRRNAGRWLAPFLLLTVLHNWWRNRLDGVSLWPEVSAQIAFGQALIAPAMLAVASWHAQRERHPGIDELSTTFTTPKYRTMLVVWSAVVVWGLIPFSAAGVLIGLVESHTATWGGPDLRPIAAGAMAILFACAFGSLLGTILPSPFLPPVWAIAWWAADGYLSLQRAAIQYFAPRSLYENVVRSVFHEPVPPSVDLKQAAWFLAAAAVSLALAAAFLERTRRAAALTVILALMMLAPTMMLAATPANALGLSQPEDPFTPVCTARRITVCVHPAYQRILDDTAQTIEAVIAPVADIPGSPTQAQQANGTSIGARPDTLVFTIHDRQSTREPLALSVALQLVSEPDTVASTAHPPALTFAQAVVATWLIQQAGFSQSIPFLDLTREFAAVTTQDQYDALLAHYSTAVDRFAALPPDVRRQWLEMHYAALRQGVLADASLP
jgi:MFS family permease